MMRSRGVVLLVLSVMFSACIAQAQITDVTDDQATPTPGVGHDYIHLLTETVNPANGSVSLRIQLPIPKSRGITVPFSIGYDSNGLLYGVGDDGWLAWGSR